MDDGRSRYEIMIHTIKWQTVSAAICLNGPNSASSIRTQKV